jgi:enamine deaminase RidA (YjgF/YER057c/UK114 family)
LDGPKVMNGASDLMVTAFGDRGKHARTTIGVSVLPGDAAVEVEGMFEVA